MASTNNNAVMTNITGSQYAGNDDKDNLLSLQEDVRSLGIVFQGLQNVMFSVVTKTSAYTATNSDYVILVNTTNNVTITLPSAVGRRGRQFFVKDSTGNAGTKNITVATSGGTIDGSATDTISTNYARRLYVSDNVNWFIIGS